MSKYKRMMDIQNSGQTKRRKLVLLRKNISQEQIPTISRELVK